MTATQFRARRRPTRALVIGGLCLVMAAALGALAWFSSVLGVRSVRVQGARAVSVQQILSSAEIPAGRPLLRLDLGAIRARVSAIPAVASVRVSTSLPDRVTIAITERVPVGYRPEGSFYRILDGVGVGFRLQAARPKTVPLIDAQASTAMAAAELGVAQSMPAVLRSKVATISAPTSQALTLTLTDGRVVLWGADDRDDDKARLLQALIAQPGGYFDLSDPDFVISRPSP